MGMQWFRPSNTNLKGLPNPTNTGAIDIVYILYLLSYMKGT